MVPAIRQARPMTTTEAPQPYPPAPVAVEPVARGRGLASAVAVYLGGYILVQSLTGQLAAALAGLGGLREVIGLLLGQTLFGLLAVVVGLFLAPASAARKVLASVIVVAGVALTLASQAARLTTGFGGIPLSITLANAFFMVALLVGAGWLIVRSARLGWLALLAAFILIPLPYFFAFNGISSVISQVVLLVVLGIFGAVILVAGRPAR